MNAGAAPLAGLRIVDFAQFVAGSYCTMMLGDLGADVLKVELPDAGDPYRRQGPEFVGGEATLFLALNRNKRGIALDWKRPEGKSVVARLLESADVFVENARPGALAKHGLDYISLSRSYPHLIYCSLSGYGQTGPYAHRGGFDLILQGEGGLMSITGEDGGPPVKVGAPILDIGAAMSGLVGILAALHQRETSGRGMQVDVSLLDFSLAALTTVAQSYFASGQEPQRLGSASPQFAPYQAFRTADQSITIAGTGNETLWGRLCRVIGRPELIDDPRFRSNAERVARRDELAAIVESVLITRPHGEWLQMMEQEEIPAGPINGLGALLADPHLRERQAVLAMGGDDRAAVSAVAAPLRLDGATLPIRRYPPRLGEHTLEVLAELGYQRNEIERLARGGAITCP